MPRQALVQTLLQAPVLIHPVRSDECIQGLGSIPNHASGQKLQHKLMII